MNKTTQIIPTSIANQSSIRSARVKDPIIDTFKLWLQVLHLKYMAIWMRFLSILVFGSNKNREVTRIFIFVSFDHDKRTCFLFLENPLIVHWRNVPVENRASESIRVIGTYRLSRLNNGALFLESYGESLV